MRGISLFLFLFAVVLLALIIYGSGVAITAFTISLAFKSFLEKYIWSFLYDGVQIFITLILAMFITYMFLTDRNKVSFVANKFLDKYGK